MGSGRCGTWTIYRILEAQKGVVCTHEGFFLPWEIDLIKFYEGILRMLVNWEGDILANSSFVWINYVGRIMSMFKDPRCVCLKRDRAEVVESFQAYMPLMNHWTDPSSKHWDPNKWDIRNDTIMWPKFDAPKAEAIGLYWDQYYAAANYWASRHPDNFLILDMNDALNTDTGQRKLLSFIGISQENQRIFLNNKLNRRDKPKGALYAQSG